MIILITFKLNTSNALQQFASIYTHSSSLVSFIVTNKK